MSEQNTIDKMTKPNTRKSLQDDFKKLGVKNGMTIIVHSSLSSLGWVCGGAVAVVQALMDTVGEEGTIVMPTQTGDNSEPSYWQMPPVPEDWWPTIREEMPAFDPAITPTRGMGKIVETFRNFPGVSRSEHPTYSFAAWGKNADNILSEQPLEAGFGPSSPLAKLYDLNSSILLIGVGHDSNTSLHFAEHAILNKEKVKKGTALYEEGIRIWKTYEEIDYDSDPFEELGKAFEQKNTFGKGMVGIAECKLIEQRLIVDFARDWLKAK